MTSKGILGKGSRFARDLSGDSDKGSMSKQDIEQKFKSYTQGKGYVELRSVRYLLKRTPQS